MGVRRLPALLRWLTSSPIARSTERLAHKVCERNSPLRRASTLYAEALQQAKEANVIRAAAALDGVLVAPGATLSWHQILGPPLRVRGFQAGPELHDGVLQAGAGGGACQVANLLFWLGAHGGLTVIERHRHGQDLFPDDDRTVPFGCGATVFHPLRDLRLQNPHPVHVQLSFEVRQARVHGALLAAAPLEGQWHLEEEDHRFVRRDGVVWRSNRIVRVHTVAGRAHREPLIDNLAQVAYPVPDALLETP